MAHFYLAERYVDREWVPFARFSNLKVATLKAEQDEGCIRISRVVETKVVYRTTERGVPNGKAAKRFHAGKSERRA